MWIDKQTGNYRMEIKFTRDNLEIVLFEKERLSKLVHLYKNYSMKRLENI